MDGRVQHDSNLMIIEREHGIFYLENGRPGFFRPREHVTDHDALMGLTVKSIYEGRLNFFACALISFTTDLGFAIVIPSLWPYLKTLNASQTFFGIVVASFSVGRAVGAPFFASKMDRPYKRVFIAALILDITANVIYVLTRNLWGILAGRFLSGFSSGIRGCVQSYVSETSLDYERTGVMAKLGAATTLAYVLGPAFGSAFAHIRPVFIGIFLIDKLNMPGIVNMALLTIVIIFVLVAFHESRSDWGSGLRADDTFNDSTEEASKPKASIPLIISLNVTQFMLSVCFVVYETIATPLTGDYYSWGIEENGWMWIGVSVASAMSYFGVGFLSTRTKDIYILLVCYVGIVAAMALMIDPTQHVPLWRWLFGTALVALFYPGCDAELSSTYSKAITNTKKSNYFGLFTMSGAIARITGPIWATAVYAHVGAWLVFGITGTCQLLSFVLLLFCCKPLNIATESAGEEKEKQLVVNENEELLAYEER